MPDEVVLTKFDHAIYEVIAYEARTSRHPGIKTLRGYTTRTEVVARLSMWNERSVNDRISKLIRVGVVKHYYDRHGMHLFLPTDKTLAVTEHGGIIVTEKE